MSEQLERTELVMPQPATALAGLLGVPVPGLDAGESLPLFWHWCYLLDRPAQAELGPDGHPVNGGIPTPPGPGRRRMSAGGRIESRAPLVVGQEATRRSFVSSTTTKHGRSGELTFVTVVNHVQQGDVLVLVDGQVIVYRTVAGQLESEASRPPADAQPPAEPGPDAIRLTWAADPTLLFRFSALTYNAHRIHYDRDYARDVEGYPGLLVHGPLQAILMAECVRALAPARGFRRERFAYRFVAPHFDGGDITAWAAPEGGLLKTQVHDAAGAVSAVGQHEFLD